MANPSKSSPHAKVTRQSISDLVAKKGRTPIVMITAYDATMARLVDDGVDAILVGDSLGNVVQGRETTLSVTLEEMIYHTRIVVRGSRQAFIIADLPFLSYQPSVEDALRSAGRCLKEGLAQAVKLEGGRPVIAQVEALAAHGMPVVGHLGLTPQSIHAFGGHGKRAKTKQGAEELLQDCRALQEAGACMVVLENIPHELARQATAALAIPTIGIGAGPHCDGQVQVCNDLFGFDPDFTPRHAKPLAQCGSLIRQATAEYAAAVRKGQYLSR